jgi:acyl dehydratase
MAKRMLESLDALKEELGKEVAVSDWFTVTQERIKQFADTTLDHNWIHVDVERAKKESPFKTTIAHGFLTLSLMAYFMQDSIGIKQGVRMGLNYGLNRLRFVSPVRVGSKIRAHFTLIGLKEVEGNGVEGTYNASVEIEGSEKPALVAEWLVRYYR